MIWSCTHSGPKSEPQTLLSPYCFASQAAPLILYAYRTYAAYVLYLQMLQITNQTVWDKPHVNDSANQPICMANFAIPPWSYNSFLRHECGPIHHAAICTYTLGISVEQCGTQQNPRARVYDLPVEPLDRYIHVLQGGATHHRHPFLRERTSPSAFNIDPISLSFLLLLVPTFLAYRKRNICTLHVCS